MSLDLGLVKAVIKSKDLNPIFEVGADAWLIGEGKECFDFVVKHFRTYGVLPDEATTKEQLGGMLADSIFNSTDMPVQYYIDNIKKRALNKLIESTVRIVIDDIKTADPEAGLTKLKNLVHAAGQQKLEKGIGVNLTRDVEERIREYKRVEALGDGIDGWRTPWPTMDKITQGFHAGDVSFFVGRLYVGKTWNLLATIIPAMRQGASCLVISMEMPPQKLGRRIDALFGGFSYEDLRKGKLGEFGFQRYEKILKEDYKEMGDLWCYGPPRVRTVADIEVLVQQHRPDIVFIDGVYLLGGGGVSDRFTKVLHAAEELKYMSVANKVSTVGTIQFRKQASEGKRGNSMDGDVEDVGYSYGLAQIADNMFGLYQNDDFVANKFLLVKFLKVRESARSRGFVINWNFDNMDFHQIGIWDGEDVLPTDKDGNVVEEATEVKTEGEAAPVNF